MDKINRSLEQLISDILMSDIYKEYDSQRNRVNNMPELKVQIDEFRMRNMELQNSNPTFEQIDSFERQYAGFRENPVVNDFLAAELEFCRLIQDITLRLTDAMHFE